MSQCMYTAQGELVCGEDKQQSKKAAAAPAPHAKEGIHAQPQKEHYGKAWNTTKELGKGVVLGMWGH